MPQLRTDVIAGHQLTHSMLVEMNTLRLTLMRLKPTTDPKIDFEELSNFCRKCEYVFLLRNNAHKLVGMFVARIQRSSFNGIRFVILHGDFGFVLPEYRGHPLYIIGKLRVFLRFWLQSRGAIVLLGGIGYPAGLLAIGHFKPMYLSCDRDLPPVIQAAFELLIKEGAGARWDWTRGRKDMPTIPPEMPPGWHERIQREAFYGRYIAHCPDWSLGYALASLAPIRTLPALLSLGRATLRRRQRRATSG